jgi:hypothetical protein
MADQPTYKFLPEDKCLSESQLFDYIDGKLKASDMHFIEKHILSCGFCSDALEGLEKVNDRKKVAAFIPPVLAQEKENEPKVIPLNPNRKYYAIAAGVVLILGITMFMKLSVSDDMHEAKMAEVTNADSLSKMPSKDAPVLTFNRADSISQEQQIVSGNTTRSANGVAERGDKTIDEPAFKNVYPQPDNQQADGLANGATYSDDNDGDDFVNIVDAKVSEREAKQDAAKEENYDNQVLAEKSKLLKRPEKDHANKKAVDAEVSQDMLATDAPATTETTVITQGAANTTGPSSPTPASSSSTYLWSTMPSGGVTNANTPNTTVPASTGSYTVTMDTTTVIGKKNEGDLSYENANKMLASGQAAASLALYDEILKNPAHIHYQDAQWKKAEALIQLKRIDEAKKLLNEIAAKTGKYQIQAKEKLKTL